MWSEPRDEGRSVVGPIFHDTKLHRNKNPSQVYEDARKSHENNTPTPRSEGITWTNRIAQLVISYASHRRTHTPTEIFDKVSLNSTMADGQKTHTCLIHLKIT